MDYDKDIRIDETALDVEWLEQPMLMRKYGQYQAETRQAMSLAKERLEYIKAKLDREIRSDPDAYGLPKTTEGAISGAITLHEDYQDAMKDYIDAQYENDVAIAAVKAFEQRKTSLENLVRLYGQQYFAGPSVPRDLSQEWVNHENQKRSNAKIKIGGGNTEETPKEQAPVRRRKK